MTSDGVDFVAGYLLVELRERQAVSLEEAEEAVFEVGSGGALFGALKVTDAVTVELEGHL